MTKASLVFLLGLLAGCANPTAKRYFYGYAEKRLTAIDIDRVLQDRPLPADQNIRVISLGADDSVSHHLVQVRHAEPLHIHKTHDLTVMVYQGRGRMTIGTNLFELATGDVVYVPRNIRHRFENAGSTPAVAIVAFSPALNDKDMTVVEQK